MEAKSDKKGAKCTHCGKMGHIRRFCRDYNKQMSQKEHCVKRQPEKENMAEKGKKTSKRGESLGFVMHVSAANASSSSNDVWVIDSGATCHMCHNRNLLNDYAQFEDNVHVRLGDGKILHIRG